MTALLSAILFIPWFKFEGITIPGTEIGIQPFGVLVAIGVLAGMRLSEWHGEKLGMRKDVVSDAATHVVIIGFVFGHVFDMVFYYPEKVLERPWELLMVWTSLSSYGGFFGSALGGFYWSWRRKLPMFPVYDQIAFGIPLGWFFGRLGCFVVHDHPGAITDFPLAVDNFTYNGVTGPRHDLGFYEVLWAAAVVPFFLWLDRKPRPYGFYIGMCCVLYAPVRFGLDFLREADKTYDGWTPGHFSSFVTLALGLYVFWRTYYRPVTSLPAAMLAEPKPPTAAAQPAP
ncbi:MAG TPA: prolipoprotein diacylglyceryl transferase family protein [Polyangiales bacterium]|nr:prolipoprotein diacylglyceryl transferase family protein [Polyangiales bacterium]